MGAITSNYPLSDLKDKIQSFSSKQSRETYSKVFRDEPHINASCCDCKRCKARRASDKPIVMAPLVKAPPGASKWPRIEFVEDWPI